MPKPLRSARALVMLRTLVLLTVASWSTGTAGQGTRADYQRAEQFLAPAVNDLVLNERPSPHWIADSDRFWYVRQLAAGKHFVIVDPAARTRVPAFDHDRLAAGLATVTGMEVTGSELPFDTFEFIDDESSIRVAVEGDSLVCDLQSYACRREGEAPPDGPQGPRLEVASPDGQWVAYQRNYNLWVRSTASGEEFPLSSDGAFEYDYSASIASPTDMVPTENPKLQMGVAAVWSPDSRKIISYRLDRRAARTFSVTQSVPETQFRPISYTYPYALPGEVGIAHAEPVIFDVYARTAVQVEADPIDLTYYFGPRFTWFEDSARLSYRYLDRGYTTTELREVDAATGAVRALVHESAEPHYDTWILRSRILGEGAEVLWMSERDGWAHLYLYDGATGALKHQITSGEWVVREIVRVDEEARIVYFTGGGREAGRDPYFRHLYRVPLDGGDVTLLTPENAEHQAQFSPSGKYFVDNYSRVDMAPVTVLRDSHDGSVVMELETADITALLATGWSFPEAFQGKGRDGQTDIYGLIWRPTNFDASRTYPVVEQIYTGPHSAFVPKSFRAYRSMSQAIAELGFITVMIDGMGTNHRGKAFSDFSYDNLGDGGIDDHIALLRQIAVRYPYIDLDRVGIWGGSAGGYDSTHAMLTHPDFYDVGVSTSGNHDHRMDKASWNEMWMGFPVGEHYVAQSNYTLAANLQGKLLLAHGELDQNVPITATLKLVDALIKANKDFDFLIMPGRFHGLGGPYFNRKRWDYFVEHLLGVEPPAGYQIGASEGASPR